MSVTVRRVQRQGNSLLVGIPGTMARLLELRKGDNVLLTIVNGNTLLMRKVELERLARQADLELEQETHPETEDL